MILKIVVKMVIPIKDILKLLILEVFFLYIELEFSSSPFRYRRIIMMSNTFQKFVSELRNLEVSSSAEVLNEIPLMVGKGFLM